MAKGIARVPNQNEPNKLVVIFPPSTRKGDYNIWTTDYKSYSLVYSCSQIIPYFVKLELVWILSREPVLSQEIIDRLKHEMAFNGIKITDFEKTDQTNCKY